MIFHEQEVLEGFLSVKVPDFEWGTSKMDLQSHRSFCLRNAKQASAS